MVNGSADEGGAIYADAASLLLTNTDFQTNTASAFGGAIRLMANSDLVVIGGSFSENLALSGGAIHATTTALQFDSVEILDNTALENGGGVYIETGSTLFDQSSNWKANWSEKHGGCLYANSDEGGESQPGVLTFRDSVFEECRSNAGHGGGIAAYRWVTVDAENASFIENYAHNGGGALYMYDSNAASVFTGCSFEGNRSRWYRGGAIHAYTDNELTFQDTSFTQNMSDKEGGAISTYRRSPLTLQNVAFVKNTSERRVGGAIWVSQVNRDEYDVTVEHCEFTENTADLGGGALAVIDGGLVQIDEVSFTDNRVESVGPGGGLFLFQNGAVRVSHTEFLGNNATYGGGVYDENRVLTAHIG